VTVETEALGLPTFVIDPVDIKKAIDVVKKAVEVVKTGKPAVVVSRRPCTFTASTGQMHRLRPLLQPS
jgi:indolepyruvate ferredoxin oxidoreductase alpha subunit